MKKGTLAALITMTLMLAACQDQSTVQKTPDTKTPASQVSADVTGTTSGSQEVVSATQETQQTHLKIEGEKILPTDKPIEVDLSQVYDATAHREESGTQAVKP
jgi:uncharacterized lipoprotein YajG